MYLVTLYFDQQTNRRIQSYIDKAAKQSGNRYMQEAQVPPHLTLSAFEAADEEKVRSVLEKKFSELKSGSLIWCSASVFFPHVICLSPVLNEYLHFLSCEIFQTISEIEGVRVSRFYRPFQWQPHTTVAKKLDREEMLRAFQSLQNSFAPFEGKAVRIGLSKPNPHRDLMCRHLPAEQLIF